ncbi:MAG: WhiB family transcriptional regulator [Actinomycetota bacterium]|nr:WhiB family transcriptional regulator [Actinomycetota bacterium]
MSWQTRAACRGMPTAIFFPHDGNYRAAAKVCARCEVRAACAAAGTNEPDGMWGGITPLERGFVPSGGRNRARAAAQLRRLTSASAGSSP